MNDLTCTQRLTDTVRHWVVDTTTLRTQPVPVPRRGMPLTTVRVSVWDADARGWREVVRTEGDATDETISEMAARAALELL